MQGFELALQIPPALGNGFKFGDFLLIHVHVCIVLKGVLAQPVCVHGFYLSKFRAIITGLTALCISRYGLWGIGHSCAMMPPLCFQVD